MPETTELVLVRHGEAIANINMLTEVAGVCRGLTDRGREQADLVAARLAAQMVGEKPFDVVCHSPVRRAEETTERILAALGPDIPVETFQDLRVCDHGGSGVHPWDVEHNAIGTIPPLDPETSPNPGDENWQSYLDRAGKALLEISERHHGKRVLVVAHSETVAASLHAFARLPAGASRWIYPVVMHTALTGWQRQFTQLPGGDPAGQWALLYANDDSHLPAEDRLWSKGWPPQRRRTAAADAS